jgi:hypothetical protein
MDHRLRTGRRRSFNELGHARELTFTGDHRFQFLASGRTCHWLPGAIAIARTELGFALGAFVFLPEHVHWTVWPRRPVSEVSDILSEIQEPARRKAVKYLKVSALDWLPRITWLRGGSTER